jgi:hypothetical protein
VRVAHKYDDDFGHSGMSDSERSIPGARARMRRRRVATRAIQARARTRRRRVATRANRRARRALGSCAAIAASERASLLFAAAAAVPFLARARVDAPFPHTAARRAPRATTRANDAVARVARAPRRRISRRRATNRAFINHFE